MASSRTAGAVPERPQKHQPFGDRPEPASSVASMPSADGHRPSPAEPSSAVAPGNVDKVLFKNLVEIVPLVESLMDRKAHSSFTRRASVVYTPTPSQLRKVADLNGRKTVQTVSAKKRRDTRDNANLEDAGDDFSIFSSRAAAEDIEKDRKELAILREQVDDLQKKLLEKDEALKSAENSINQMNATYVSLDELKHQVAEKDSLMKYANSELYNAKIKLADKQAALEKLEWEARMSNRKVEELQGNAVSMEFEVTALMRLFEELSKNDSAAYPDVDIDSFNYFEQLPHIDDIDAEKMEDARIAYLAAVAAAKENPSEESIAAAAEARLRLQAFVL